MKSPLEICPACLLNADVSQVVAYLEKVTPPGWCPLKPVVETQSPLWKRQVEHEFDISCPAYILTLM